MQQDLNEPSRSIHILVADNSPFPHRTRRELSGGTRSSGNRVQFERLQALPQLPKPSLWMSLFSEPTGEICRATHEINPQVWRRDAPQLVHFGLID